MHKFINGDKVKYQDNLDCKKDLEKLGYKLDVPKPEPKPKPKHTNTHRKTTNKKV